MPSLGINSTNRVPHAKVRETAYGVIPVNPAWQALRVTGSPLNANPQTVVSDEIRQDRQVADLILVGVQAGGDIPVEFSFNAHDADVEEVLQNLFTNNPAILNTASNTPISALSATTATVTAGGAAFLAGMIVLFQGFPTAANNKAAVVASSTGTTVVFAAATFTAETAAIPATASMRVVGFQGASGDITATATGLASTTLNFTTLGLVIGQWLKIGGAAAGKKFATAANNDWVRISTVGANALTFDRLPVGWAVDAGAAVTLMIWAGDYVRNGSTQISNTFERQYLDMTPVQYEYLTGMCIDKLSITVQAQRIVTLVKSYLGASGAVQSARVSGSTDIAAPTYSVMNAASNIGRVAIAGAALTGPGFVTEMTMEIQNNLRQLNAVGNLSAIGVGNGEFDITGRMNFFFGDPTVFNYILNNTAVSFDFRITDSATPKETFVFDLPRIKFTSGAPSVPGKNQNVMLDAAYRALRDPVLGYTLHAQRHWYTE